MGQRHWREPGWSPLPCSPVITPRSGLGSLQKTEMERKGAERGRNSVLTVWSLGLKPWQELRLGHQHSHVRYTRHPASRCRPHTAQTSAGVCTRWEALSAVVVFYWAHSMTTRVIRRIGQAGRNRGPPGDLKSYVLPTGTKCRDLPNGKLQLQRVGKVTLIGQMKN